MPKQPPFPAGSRAVRPALGRPRRSRRRWVYLLLVLAVASLLGWWGATQETRRTDAIRATMIELLATIDSDEDREGGMSGQPPMLLLETIESSSMRVSVLRELRRTKQIAAGNASQQIDIRVAPQKSDPFGRPAPTTHTATLAVNGRDIVTFEIVCRDPEEVEIIGYRQ